MECGEKGTYRAGGSRIHEVASKDFQVEARIKAWTGCSRRHCNAEGVRRKAERKAFVESHETVNGGVSCPSPSD